jgi:beta-glucosidase-like glycosyl hydrolase/CubicO group peptidase (beta-lactamase class C family)
MIAAYSNKDLKHVKEMQGLIETYNIGGLIWMQGGPVREGRLANFYQTLAKTPLLYSMDAEWGLSMRLDSTQRYPRQMTLGAIRNDSLIYYMGKQVAYDCKRLGLHINFAPDADVNNNPANPVIGMRSFGEDKYKVAQKAYMYMLGMQSEHILANGKHFPGHGDTDSDSHTSLPMISQSRQRLDSLELYPFRYLFERGLGSVMVAHLQIPALDTTRDLPSTLSPKIVTDLLKNELGFKGLIFTDALNMKGAAGFVPGLVEVKALQAGNDVLLFSADVAKAMTEIKNALAAGQLNQQDIDARVKKILKTKYWCGLNSKQEIVTRGITADLNSAKSEALNDKLTRAALTLLKNENQFLPLKNEENKKILEISIGAEDANQLYANLRTIMAVEHAGITHSATAEQLASLYTKVNAADLVVIQLCKSNLKPENNFGVSAQSLRVMDSIAVLKPTALVLLSNPYLMNRFTTMSAYKAVLLGYENMPAMQRAMADGLAGLCAINGRLPVSTNLFKLESGIDLPALSVTRKKLEDQFANRRFYQVDSIAKAGIAEHAYPGCQIVALKDGKVIYQKSFGNYTYEQSSKAVDNGTMYDLASVTKIAATAFALMKLSSEGKFDYTKTLGDYLPELKGSDKANLKIEDVLTHQAGLQAWIPYFQNTIGKNKSLKSDYYSRYKSDEFPTQVAHDLFVVKGYNDTIMKLIIASKLKDPGTYLYSDLGYYFMQRIIEKETGMSLDKYLKDFYFKLGIGLTYQPLNYFSKVQIAPTENDESFRKQLIQGYVHDPGAALMGGIAGHAGLFGNALELSKVMQLYLNKGELNGIRLLDSNVVKAFTACRFCPSNRRGLCFEKPETDDKKPNPVVAECSAESYGHSGFTGTFAWVDPKTNTVIVFLSNRVYPSAEDNKLTKLGIRGKIQKAFYEALK